MSSSIANTIAGANQPLSSEALGPRLGEPDQDEVNRRQAGEPEEEGSFKAHIRSEDDATHVVTSFENMGDGTAQGTQERWAGLFTTNPELISSESNRNLNRGDMTPRLGDEVFGAPGNGLGQQQGSQASHAGVGSPDSRSQAGDHDSIFGSAPDSPMEVDTPPGLALPGSAAAGFNPSGASTSSSLPRPSLPTGASSQSSGQQTAMGRALRQSRREADYRQQNPTASAGASGSGSAQQQGPLSTQAGSGQPGASQPTGASFSRPGQRAVSPGGTSYTAHQGLKLKGGGYGGVSGDQKRFLLPGTRDTGYNYASGKIRDEDARQGMRELLDPGTGLQSLEKGAQAFGAGKTALSTVKKNNFPELIDPNKSAGSKKGAVTMGSEGRSAAAQKGVVALGSAGRSAAIAKGRSTLGSEGRSAAAARRVANMGPEGLSAAAAKRVANMGPERRSASVKKAKATMGSEGVSAAAKKGAANRLDTMGSEGLRSAAKKRIATMGPEGLASAGRKVANTRFFGKDKDDGLTTEAPENPGSFFPQRRQPPTIDLTQDPPSPMTPSTDSDRDDDMAEPDNEDAS
jgi:hypothetical protein